MSSAPEFNGDRIRRLREAKRLSQYRVCRLAGISPSTLIAAEIIGRPTRRTAERLAGVLGCTTEEILPPPSEAEPVEDGGPRLVGEVLASALRELAAKRDP